MSDKFSMGGSFTAGSGNGMEPNMTGQANSGSLSGMGGGQPPADLIKDTTTEGFMADVIEASKEQPVLVDFWAPWCGPCKQLGPMIEGAVTKAGGRVKLVKMNIDDHPAVAGQMGIQSIPAVVAFKDGQPVDGFMGAVPESQINEFIDKIAGPGGASPVDALMEEAEAALSDKDYGTAAQAFATVLQAEPGQVRAMAGMAECYLGTDQIDKAEELVGMVKERMPEAAEEPTFKAVITKLELLAQAEDLGEVGDMMKALEADPDNHQVRFDMALALNGRGDKAGAVDALLEIMKRDREWNEDGARTQLLQFFEAWGAKDPETKLGRRKLSAQLFS